MAAPQSAPDLSVVNDEKPSEKPTETASKPSAASPPPASAAGPGTAAAQPAGRSKRRGVPIWVVLAVAILGAVLFFNQYQRAEQLDAQVVALGAELEEVGQQLSAYQTHLDSVRAGVGDLTERIGSLNVLVNRDPLAPVESPEAAAEAFETPVEPNFPAPFSRESSSFQEPAVIEPAPEYVAPIEVEDSVYGRPGYADSSSDSIGADASQQIRERALSAPIEPDLTPTMAPVEPALPGFESPLYRDGDLF